MEKSLFEQTRLGNLKMKNRFIAAAVGNHKAVNGHMTKDDFNIYKTLSNGKVSTIITGYTYISDYYVTEGMFGIYDDTFIPEYKVLTDTVHQNSTNIILQLVHPGAYTLTDTKGARVLGPSAIENLVSKITPIEMTKEDIQIIHKEFAKAAGRAKKSGFDGVEIHAAHGFLLNQFLTPYYNRRTDEYGGNDDNRARMLTETIRCVREEVGSEYPILVKISCMDGIKDGITFSGFQTACRLLMKAGVDAIEVSGAWTSFESTDSLYFLDYADKIAKESEVPIILVGGIRDIDTADKVLNSTAIEYFSMARPLISEPDLISRWLQGSAKESRCIRCNNCIRLDSWRKCILNYQKGSQVKGLFNYDGLITQIQNCCLTEAVCGNCKKENCYIGYCRQVFMTAINQDGFSVTGGLDKIPSIDVRYYDDEMVINALAYFLRQCRNCNTFHDENKDCIINIFRSALEIILLGEAQEYKGSALVYLNDLKAVNPVVADRIFTAYRENRA